LIEVKSKPTYLIITDSIGMKVPFIWCVGAAVIGAAFFNATDAILTSVMVFLMTWVSFTITSFMLGIQQNIGLLSNLAYDRVIKFIWFSAAFGFVVSVICAVGKVSSSIFFFTAVSSIVYFGFALAAARKWGEY